MSAGSNMFRNRRSSLLLTFGTVLALAGCADDAPPVVQSFPALHFEYLPKIRLNVGAIDVQDRSLPVGPQDIAAQSPAVPAQALQQMARDRLFAAGTAGTAVFTIDQASIVREPGGALDGHLAVHLDITNASGLRSGFAEAQISRQHVPGTNTEQASAVLYDMTRHMMDDMNIELEYQAKRTLRPFLVAPGDAPAPVAAQDLSPQTAPPAVPAPPALPPADPGDAAPAPLDPVPPQEMSPPPGYLQAPPAGP